MKKSKWHAKAFNFFADIGEIFVGSERTDPLISSVTSRFKDIIVSEKRLLEKGRIKTLPYNGRDLARVALESIIASFKSLLKENDKVNIKGLGTFIKFKDYEKNDQIFFALDANRIIYMKAVESKFKKFFSNSPRWTSYEVCVSLTFFGEKIKTKIYEKVIIKWTGEILDHLLLKDSSPEELAENAVRAIIFGISFALNNQLSVSIAGFGDLFYLHDDDICYFPDQNVTEFILPNLSIEEREKIQEKIKVISRGIEELEEDKKEVFDLFRLKNTIENEIYRMIQCEEDLSQEERDQICSQFSAQILPQIINLLKSLNDLKK